MLPFLANKDEYITFRRCIPNYTIDLWNVMVATLIKTHRYIHETWTLKDNKDKKGDRKDGAQNAPT